MSLFEAVDELYQKVYNYHEYSRALVTIAAFLGILIIFIYAVKFLFALAQGIYLYVFAQLKCCQTNYIERYGKWAVITGATDGIGLSMAKELAKRGMSILLVARNAEKLASSKALLEAIPNVGLVETIQINLADSSLRNFAKIRQQIDPDNRDIGMLINNAGHFPDQFQRFNRFNMEELLMLANLNMLAPLHMTRMIMPGMVQRGKGMVMNVSSLLGFVTVPYMSIYSATKTFLIAFTRQLQSEYASHPIDILLLTPGAVQTKLLAAATTFKRSSSFNPSADDYARSAINAISARCNQYSGTIMHGLLRHGNGLFANTCLWNSLVRMNIKTGASKFELSPVPRRKKLADNRLSNA